MLAPLDADFNRVVLHIVNVLMPNGFDTTDNGDEVNTLDKIKNYFNETGRVKVWTGASHATIFGYPHVNHAFRAWHDYVHIMWNYEFTPEDELKVMRVQQNNLVDILTPMFTEGMWEGDKGVYTRDQVRKFVKYLEAEVQGQIEYEREHGQFPEDQRAFFERYISCCKM